MGEKEEEKKPAEGGEKNPAESGEKKPADSEEKKPADSEEKKPADSGEKKPAVSAEKKPAEKEEEKKPAESGEKKAAEGGEKKKDAPIDVVLKLNLHCEGCAKKVKRAVSKFEGVEKVNADLGANKLIVIGNIDPELIREKVESKTKKKVDLISPLPKKAPVAEKKSDEKKAEKPKQPVVATVVLKVRLHCQGCAHKIKRTILKNVDGAESVITDLEKDSVTVTGTMDVKDLTSFLQEKIRRSVEVVPTPTPKPKEDGAGGGKKEEKKKEGAEKEEENKKESSGGAGDKKAGGEPKMEFSKMEYGGYSPYTHSYAIPMFNQSYPTCGYVVQHAPPPPTYLHADYGYFNQNYHPGYFNPGYPVHGYGPPPPPPAYASGLDDRMFSDENPQGCSVM